MKDKHTKIIFLDLFQYLIHHPTHKNIFNNHVHFPLKLSRIYKIERFILILILDLMSAVIISIVQIWNIFDSYNDEKNI